MAASLAKRSWGARLVRWSAYLLIGVLVLSGALFLAMRVASDPVPSGESGPRADALARKIEQAVDIEAWQRTGAVRFSFMGRNHHLWDKQANRHHVRWGDKEVVLDLGTQRGCARVDGVLQTGEAQKRLIERAYALWVNDTYWLNPLGKFFDPGVVRKVVPVEGHGDALLITFTLNGLTPGDSYLWLLDSAGRPTAWRMWTKIPLGGAAVSWAGWTKLATGALISTHHDMLGLGFDLEDVAGAATVTELLGRAENPMNWCKVQ